MRKIQVFKTAEPNSLVKWYRVKNPLRVVVNFLVIEVCRFLPSLALKRFLLRLLGMKIGRNVSVGFKVQFDIFFPEKISLQDNCLLGYNVTVLAHEFLIKEYRVGEVVIGKNALIGTNSTILPGVEIGENAVVSTMSLVNKDVPANAFVGGIPIREINK